jgi:hypothetical protein
MVYLFVGLDASDAALGIRAQNTWVLRDYDADAAFDHFEVRRERASRLEGMAHATRHATRHAPRTTHHAPRTTRHAPRATRHAPRATHARTHSRTHARTHPRTRARHAHHRTPSRRSSWTPHPH